MPCVYHQFCITPLNLHKTLWNIFLCAKFIWRLTHSQPPLTPCTEHCEPLGDYPSLRRSAKRKSLRWCCGCAASLFLVITSVSYHSMARLEDTQTKDESQLATLPFCCEISGSCLSYIPPTINSAEPQRAIGRPWATCWAIHPAEYSFA